MDIGLGKAKLSSLANTVTPAPVPDSDEILQLPENTGICAGSRETSSVKAKSSILPRERPAKQRRKEKATESAPRIREQSIEADVQFTSRSRPKRRAAEDAAAKVMADLIEEEQPIDKKRRDEVLEMTVRKRQKKTATPDETAESKSRSDAIVVMDEMSAAALPAGLTDLEVKDTGHRKRARKAVSAKDEDPPLITNATASSEELAPSRIPLAETDLNNTMLHAVLDVKGIKSPQASKIMHRSKIQSPSKPTIQETAPKRKRGRPRLSVHHDAKKTTKSNSRQEHEILEPLHLPDDDLQPEKLVAKRAVPSAESGENVKEEKTLKKRKIVEATAPKIENKNRRMIDFDSESRPASSGVAAHVSSDKRQHGARMDDVSSDATFGKHPETSGKPTVLIPSYKPSSISVSDTMVRVPNELQIQPQPTKKKRGRPKKIVASTVPVEMLRPPLPPTDYPDIQTNPDDENDKTDPPKPREETNPAHARPSMIPPTSRNRPRTDENVDWLFASDPVRINQPSVVSRPRTTITTAAQSKKVRKLGARENLPEMDLEELLSGITCLANASSSLQSHVRLAGKSRMKG
jgi:hypothetical protein